MTENKCVKKKGKFGSLIFDNNGGNSLVLVVVVMFVVMLLGVAVLYSSYTAVILRSSQRKSEKTFTSAEEGMEIIREGLSKTNSDAIEAGYQALLSNFSKDKSVNKETFRKAYMSALSRQNKGLFRVNTGLDNDVVITGYSKNAINAYLKDSKYTDYTLNIIKNGTIVDNTDDSTDVIGTVQITKNNNIILRGIRLVYKGKNGYEEQITTDFRLSVPDTSIGSTYVGFNDALKDFNFIADQGLLINRYGETGSGPDSGSFEGSGYAGKVVINKGTLTVSAGRQLVVGQTREVKVSQDDKSITPITRGSEDKRTSGDILFTGVKDANGSINVEQGGTLWANNIELKNKATLTAKENSHIFIHNDLNFVTGGTATLKGTYYGFGNGTPLWNRNGTLTDSPNDSSSIIFNKKGSLDITGIESLTLAGKSFITESSSLTSKNSGMGSSISTRPEQQVYLLPNSFFNSLKKDDESTTDTTVYTNPRIINTESDANSTVSDSAIASIDPKKFTDKIDGLSRPLSSYGINSTKDLKVITYNIPGNENQWVRYYFLDFKNDQSKANAYFKDYFNNNKEKINSYISSYADLSGFSEKPGLVRTAGTTLIKENGSYKVTGGDANIDDAQTYCDEYKNLSDTLNASSDGPTTPFHTFIDVEELHKICKKDDIENAQDGSVRKRAKLTIATPRTKVMYNASIPVNVYAYWGDLTIAHDINDSNIIDHGDRKPYTYASGGDGNGLLKQDCVYVVDGDVRISGDFNGIILCSGTLELGVSHMTLEPKGLQALKQTDLWKGSHGSSEETGDNKWEDVKYENWKKD